MIDRFKSKVSPSPEHAVLPPHAHEGLRAAQDPKDIMPHQGTCGTQPFQKEALNVGTSNHFPLK